MREVLGGESGKFSADFSFLRLNESQDAAFLSRLLSPPRPASLSSPIPRSLSTLIISESSATFAQPRVPPATSHPLCSF